MVPAAAVMRFFALLRMTAVMLVIMLAVAAVVRFFALLRMTAVTLVIMLAVATVVRFFALLRMTAVMLREKVVMLRAFHGGGLESVAELYAANAWNREDCVRNKRLRAVPKRLSKADRKPGHDTLDNSAQGVAFRLYCLKGIGPGRWF